MFRPSGTEPKLKVYIEHQRAVQEGEDLPDVSHSVETLLCAFETALREILSRKGH